MKDVAGKTAFITGGGSGVGFGMASAFANAGMKVVIADVREDHLDEAVRQLADVGEIHAVRVDVTDREAMATAVDEAERVFGKVHVVCNNAGVNLFNDIGSATYQDWDWVLGVNLGGVVNGVQVRGARPVGGAALEPPPPRDRRLGGLPGARQEQDLRERQHPPAGALHRHDSR